MHNIFFHHTAEGGRLDSWTAEEMEDKLRIVSVCVSVSMHWRHTRRFESTEYNLAVSLDSEQPISARSASQNLERYRVVRRPPLSSR